MEQRKVPKGVPVRSVRGKSIKDNRFHYNLSSVFLAGLVLVVVLMNFRFLIISLSALLFVLVFGGCLLVRKLTHYCFVAEDGYYIVHWGRAVRIPWEKIHSVEVTAWEYGYRPAIWPFTYSRRRLIQILLICFQPDIVDEVTGAPVEIKTGRDDIFPFTKTALNCFQRHVMVTKASA